MLFFSKKKDAFLRGIPAVLFFAFSTFLYAQAEQTLDSLDAEQFLPAGEDGAGAQAQGRQLRETDESLILIDPTAGSASSGLAAADAPRSYSSAGAVLRLIVVLALLCVACYFILRLIRKSQGGNVSTDPFLQVTASLSLGQGKSVSVVTLGGRAFLLGVSENSVSLIAEITDSELIDQMNLSGGSRLSAKKSFAEMLSDLMPKSRQKENAESSSAASPSEATASFIRERRASLKERQGDDQ